MRKANVENQLLECVIASFMRTWSERRLKELHLWPKTVSEAISDLNFSWREHALGPLADPCYARTEYAHAVLLILATPLRSRCMFRMYHVEYRRSHAERSCSGTSCVTFCYGKTPVCLLVIHHTGLSLLLMQALSRVERWAERDVLTSLRCPSSLHSVSQS